MFYLKKLPFLSLLFAGFLTLNGAAQAATSYPLTLKNCDRTLVFDKAPEAIISIGQHPTETLYLLGLADKMKGTSFWFSPVLPEYEEINAKIERMADNEPSFEAVLGKRPDFVISQYEWAIGPMGRVGTYEQFDEVGVPIYTSPSDCQDKDNSTAGDGLRSVPFTMEVIYQEIAELAQIFDIEERGAAAIANLKAREQAAIDKVKHLPKDKISALFWFSSPDMNMDPFVAGQLGAPGYIMRTLGLRNVAPSDLEWPSIGWETLVRANPDIIVLADSTRRRYPGDSLEAKRDYLENDPVARLMDAVVKKHIVAMDGQIMNNSIRTISGIELLAEAMTEFGFD